ncbi:hypothetical protein VFPYRCLA_015 [Candidatus Vidania fulgoroideae]|nr:hypothetical protein VFPYRCLA_015 [Candidatus Vidania fulgoroideae]
MSFKKKEIFIDFFFGYYKKKKKVSKFLRKINYLYNRFCSKGFFFGNLKYRLLPDRFIIYLKTYDFLNKIKFKKKTFFYYSSYIKYAFKRLLKALFMNKVYCYKNKVVVKEKKIVNLGSDRIVFNFLKGITEKDYFLKKSVHKESLSFLKRKYGINFFTVVLDSFPLKEINFSFFLKRNKYFKKYVESVQEYKRIINNYLKLVNKDIFLFFGNCNKRRKLVKFINSNEVSITKFKFKKKKNGFFAKNKSLKRNERICLERKKNFVLVRILEREDRSLDSKTQFFLKKKIFTSLFFDKKD